MRSRAFALRGLYFYEDPHWDVRVRPHRWIFSIFHPSVRKGQDHSGNAGSDAAGGGGYQYREHTFPAGVVAANVTANFAPVTNGAGPTVNAPLNTLVTVFGTTRRAVLTLPAEKLSMLLNGLNLSAAKPRRNWFRKAVTGG